MEVSPPPPIDQANPFAYSCSFALHTTYKMTCLNKVGKAVKMLNKQIIVKAHLSQILHKSVA